VETSFLVASTLLRSRLGEALVPQVLLSLADLAICAGIISVLDFSYRGILFIAIFNAVRFIPHGRLTKLTTSWERSSGCPGLRARGPGSVVR